MASTLGLSSTHTADASMRLGFVIAALAWLLALFLVVAWSMYSFMHNSFTKLWPLRYIRATANLTTPQRCSSRSPRYS